MRVEPTRRFQILREIASGGFGHVYLAKVLHGDGFSRLVAVKLLHPKWSDNDEIASRMRDEARLLGWLRHKHIVNVLDLTRIDGRTAIIMDYLEAVDLRVLINALTKRGNRVPLRVAFEIVSSVANALDAVYNKPPYAGEKPLRVIHRDIKPTNIMIDHEGTVKVLDFGVARADFAEREAKTEELSFGSMEYMSPERMFFEPESNYSDVYSLGATLFELLTFEKLGKAKLRAREHETFLGERMESLLRRYPMPSQEMEDIVHDLLVDMLSFRASDRPSANDCMQRLRTASRKLSQQPTLEEWSDQVLRSLIQQQERKRDAAPATDPLVGRLLSEDTNGMPRSEVLPSPHLMDDVPSLTGVGLSAGSGLSAPTLTDIPMLEQDLLLDSGLEDHVPTIAVSRGSVRPSGGKASAQRFRRWVAPAMCAVGVLMMAFGSLVSVLGAGGAVYALSATGPSAPAVARSAPEPVAAKPSGGAADGPLFVSVMQDTRYIRVQCGEDRVTGANEVRLSNGDYPECMVMAMDMSRRRASVKLKNVSSRLYRCFEGGEDVCK